MKEFYPKKIRVLTAYHDLPILKADYIKRVNDPFIRDIVYSEFIANQDDTARFVSFALERISTRQSIMLLIHGKQGTGKTVFQYYLSQLLDIPGKQIYNIEEYKQVVSHMPTKSVINFLDTTLLFPSRNFSSKDQKKLQEQINVYRAFSNVYTASVPSIEEIDVTFRRHFDQVKILNVFEKRFAHITIGKRLFVLAIPKFNEKYLQEIHKIDVLAKSKAL